MEATSGNCRFTLRHLFLFTVAVSGVLLLGITLPVLISTAYERWRIGAQFDVVSYQEPGFELRISALTERGTVLAQPGTYYRYDVRPRSFLGRWRTICQVQMPGADPIPRRHFRRVSNNIYYFVNDRVLGITVDGGNSWNCPNVDSLPEQRFAQPSYRTIQSFRLGASGVGNLVVTIVDSNSSEPLASTLLETSDFGKNWSITANYQGLGMKSSGSPRGTSAIRAE